MSFSVQRAAEREIALLERDLEAATTEAERKEIRRAIRDVEREADEEEQRE